jgi:hypothetical protein
MQRNKNSAHVSVRIKGFESSESEMETLPDSKRRVTSMQGLVSCDLDRTFSEYKSPFCDN